MLHGEDHSCEKEKTLSFLSEIPTLSLPKGRDPYQDREIGKPDHRAICVSRGITYAVRWANS